MMETFTLVDKVKHLFWIFALFAATSGLGASLMIACEIVTDSE